MGTEKVKLGIPIYKQTLSTSCGTASMLMAENFFDPKRFPATIGREIEIHKKVSFFSEGELEGLEDIAAVAALLVNDGFNVRFYLDGPRYKAPEIEEELWERCIRIFNYNLGLVSSNERGRVLRGSFNIETVRSELRQRRVCICELKYGKLITHIVVIHGFEGNTFSVADSLKGYYFLKDKELDDTLEQGFIKNFFFVWKEPQLMQREKGSDERWKSPRDCGPTRGEPTPPPSPPKPPKPN